MLYRGLEEKNLPFIRSNMGLSYAYYDEGAFRNINQDGDMRYAKEAIGLVNSGLNNQDKISGTLSIGKYYGSLEDRTLRVVHNEKLLHPFQPFSPEATKNQLNFFKKVYNDEEIIFKSINIKLIDYYLALLDGLVLAAKIADKYYEFKVQGKSFSIADLYRVERVHYYCLLYTSPSQRES